MLKTNVDKLLNILKEKKEMMISDLAVTLNTTPDNIEKIAKLLEEEKLVTIRYKMMKPYLVYGFKEKKKKEKKEIKEIKEEKGIPGKGKPLFMWRGKPVYFSFSKLFKREKKEKPKPFPKLVPKPLPKLGKLPTLPKLGEEKGGKKKSFFSKLFKKKVKKELKPIRPLPKLEKKSFFSKLFKKKEKKMSELEEAKEAIKKSKGIRLEKKPLKPVLPSLKSKTFPSKPLKEEEKKKVKIETEQDAKKEIDNLIKEVTKQKDKNLIKRNYKKALALYTQIKDTDAKINYNKKLKDLYNKLTK